MSKWDSLLETWTAPTKRIRDRVYQVPYMLFGTTVDNREPDGQYYPDTPHLAQFELIGSNKAASRVQHYLKRGFKLLKFYVPEQDVELAEIKQELERCIGSHDEELAALKAENERLKKGVLNSKVEEKKKAA